MRIWLSLVVLCSILSVSIAGKGRDFYKILGVPRNAKEEQIKKAYRDLSRKWHPDRNPENKDEATAKFYDISDAYETLSDSDKKAKYDLGGEDAVNGGQGGGQGAGFQRGDPFQQFHTFFQFFGGDMGGAGGFPGGGGFQHQHQPPVQNLYDDKSGVTEIASVSDFNTHIGQRTELVVVDYYSPTCRPCIDLKDQYIAVAKTFNGIVRVMAVNCQSGPGKQICQSQKIQNYPTIRMYLDENRQIDFPAKNEKTSKSIGNWIAESIPDLVSRIDSSRKLSDFIAQTGGRAPVILFTDKHSTPPLLKSLCRTFKTNVACGVVLNFNPSKLPEYLSPIPTMASITKTPSLLYIHDATTFEGEFFKGSMTSEILSLFFSRIVSHNSRTVGVNKLTPARKDDCSPTDSTICVLLLADPLSEGAKETYGILKELAEKYKQDPIKFFWVDPKSSFAAKFAGETLVAYRGKRGKYSSITREGSGDKAKINSWIDDILTGSGSLQHAVSKKPKHDEL